jgi:hypothetical protein
MGYYLRYIVVEGPPPTLADIAAGLMPLHPDYSLVIEEDLATLTYQDTPIAQLEVSRPGDELFEDERNELLEALSTAGSGTSEVESALQKSTGTIAAQLLAGGDDPAMVMQWIEPVWGWMFANHPGLLQVDGEGYYNGGGLVLKTD